MDYIYLHGLGQSPGSWSESLSSLPQGAKAHCPDLMKLCGEGEKTYRNMYAAFEKYADGCGDSVGLCGISLGAVLALQYAVEHPRKADSTILIAPQYKMPKLLLSVQNLLFHMLPQAAFQGMDKKDMISLAGSMKELDFTSRLRGIACPVLIVCGGRDRANRKAAEALKGLLPDAQLEIVEDAGHEVNVDAPAELAALIQKFWA